MIAAATAALEIQAKPSRDWQDIIDAIDMLGVALADHDHQWTPAERRCYERAIRTARRLVVTAPAKDDH